MLALRHKMNSDEKGFTLIELLIVVIIIGILAAVAIPAFLNQREKAWDAAAQSDLKNATTSAETFYTSEGTYAPGGTAMAQGDLEDEGFVNSDQVTLTIVCADDDEYVITAQHDQSDTVFEYFNNDNQSILDYDSSTGSATYAAADCA